MQKLFSLTRRLLILGFMFNILLTNLLYPQDNAPQKVVTIFPFHFASTDVAEKKTISELNGLFYDLFAGQFAINYVVNRMQLHSSTGYIRKLQNT